MEWPAIVAVYITPAFMMTAVGMGNLLGEFSTKEERKTGAAMLLAAPIWPLALVGFILYSIFTLYRLAWKVLRGKVEDF